MYREKFIGIEGAEPSVPAVYYNGLRGRPGYDRGPVITLFWGAYFLFVYVRSETEIPHHTFWFAAFVLAGLIGYRIDKGYRRDKPLFSPSATIWLAALVQWLLFFLRT
jgi:hypothetical protein